MTQENPEETDGQDNSETGEPGQDTGGEENLSEEPEKTVAEPREVRFYLSGAAGLSPVAPSATEDESADCTVGALNPPLTQLGMVIGTWTTEAFTTGVTVEGGISIELWVTSKAAADIYLEITPAKSGETLPLTEAWVTSTETVTADGFALLSGSATIPPAEPWTFKKGEAFEVNVYCRGLLVAPGTTKMVYGSIDHPSGVLWSKCTGYPEAI